MPFIQEANLLAGSSGRVSSEGVNVGRGRSFFSEVADIAQSGGVGLRRDRLGVPKE